VDARADFGSHMADRKDKQFSQLYTAEPKQEPRRESGMVRAQSPIHWSTTPHDDQAAE